MNCNFAQNSLSAHLDGCLPAAERRGLLEHLGTCPACSLRLTQLARVRTMLGKVPSTSPPNELTSALRVMASRERARVLARRNPVAFWGERFRLYVNNLMRPLAIPFAGGLVSAMVLFSMLMPNISIQQNMLDAQRQFERQFFTEPMVKAQSGFDIEYDDDDFVIEVVVDGQGRAVDYSIPKGENEPKAAGWRRSVQRELLFTEFVPATAFGRPTIGRMFLSFTRSKIDVPSKS